MKKELFISKPIIFSGNAVAFGHNQMLSVRSITAVSIKNNTRDEILVAGGMGFCATFGSWLGNGAGEMLLAAVLFFIAMAYAWSTRRMEVAIQCSSGKTLVLYYLPNKEGIDLAGGDYERLCLAMAGDSSVQGQSEGLAEGTANDVSCKTPAKYDALIADMKKGVKQ
ncbi:hypothetical protein ACGYLO_10520 [Sulfitobacter sp. 1A13353]|uniref:hypothetical protein n=1 Tax=Sulfitobacter sp. 1A13353 TaxID=3368568 RepID=UPI0037475DBE